VVRQAMQHITDIIIGVVAALAASVLWMLALPPLLGPKLRIDGQIKQYISRSAKDAGQPAYRVTIYNRRRRAFMDLRYELTLRYSIRDTKRQLRILVREFNGPMFVTGRSRTDDGGYGLSFHLDLPGQLQSVAQLPGFVDADLRLRVFGHDELSGVGKAFTAVFDSDSIVLLDPPATATVVVPRGPSDPAEESTADAGADAQA
jgi:hypothetical protein